MAVEDGMGVQTLQLMNLAAQRRAKLLFYQQESRRSEDASIFAGRVDEAKFLFDVLESVGASKFIIEKAAVQFVEAAKYRCHHLCSRSSFWYVACSSNRLLHHD